ncbi:TonB-dependent siderophore receptor [Ferribacterium limneticum]|uniref:TonB-dependent siderophore receptor n=1 Tax=Ferribacterium limneticum TaxID=76259 RepID=UPI001CF8DB70|nr:TonB-dependent siderophore receptor [Ferribacterium limneticum]UCV26882.1 TonB-dependent siderophore receptor [Ferribacterium limneticum]UCV30799.1 TonB-dependent siderophore receptor [Ferribacterium limneticum]
MHQPLRLALVVAAIYSCGALAQSKTFDIAAQSLPKALTTLATQSGIQILFNADELKGLQAGKLQGSLTPEEALRKLLEGSGFMASSTGKGSFVIQKRPPAEGVNTLPAVLVTASAERGYKAAKITVAGKTPQTLREIPNSVSVLTRDQMDDQNMVTTWDALSQVAGVQAISNDITQGQYHSRGGALELQHDGIPSSMPLSGYQQFDLPIYERVEVLRGPAGVLQGSGSFSGTVNFVRKRPKDVFAATMVASGGTWNNYRLEGDVTGPLNESGTLRGRAVASYIDRDYVYNRVHDQKWLAYGTLDFDFTSATKANVFFAYQKNDSTGFSGLPSYTNGSFLSVPRSFNPYPDWNRSAWDTLDIGGELNHKFDNEWIAAFKLQRRDQSFFFKDSYPTTGVNPATMTIANYARREFQYDYQNDGVDLYAAGPFNLLGRKHELLVGANYSRFESTGRGANPNSAGSAYLNVANVRLSDPPAVPEPDVIYKAGSQNVTKQSGIYSRLTLNIADPLKATVGGRFSNYSYKSHNIAPHPTPTDWIQGGKASGEFTPYAGLVYDLTRDITLYGSYADIFVPQTQQRVDLSTLDPRVGKQTEIGSKIDFFGGKLAVTGALFKIRDTNRALSDANNPGYYISAGELESKGWELELVGSPLARWDISASYTNLNTKWLNNGTSTGQPVSFWYPKEIYKLWSKYRFGEGPLSGFSLGLGINGATQSASGAPSATVAAREQNGYTVVKAQIGYTIDKNYALTLDINNLFDTTYYTRLGGTNTYNTYGDPRNVVLTLRASY